MQWTVTYTDYAGTSLGAVENILNLFYNANEAVNEVFLSTSCRFCQLDRELTLRWTSSIKFDEEMMFQMEKMDNNRKTN